MNAPAMRSAPRFEGDLAALLREEPAPLPRVALYLLIALAAAGLAWSAFGRLDIVAVTAGKLVPLNFVKIVQPAEGGIVREILVDEGDSVAAGQTLLRMDSRISEADLASVRAELDRRRLQVKRIDAELAGRAYSVERGAPAGLAAQVAAQSRARRQAHADALAHEHAVRARSVHELESAVEIETKLKQTAPIYREQARAWEQLAREGYAGRLLALDRQRSHLEAEQELKAHGRTIESLKASIAQAEKRIAQLASSYRQQLHEERDDAHAHLHRLEQDLAKLLHRNALLELRAPQAGIVQDLVTHTPGTVIAPGTVVLTLVPQDEPLVAEVWITNADAGFVQPGQKAKVKVAAYPFQKHGLLDGVVVGVGADASDRRAGPSEAPPPGAYRARVQLPEDSIGTEGRRLRLVPGMAVSAEVHIGTRTVLEYLLSPIRKVAGEAGRER